MKCIYSASTLGATVTKISVATGLDLQNIRQIGVHRKFKKRK